MRIFAIFLFCLSLAAADLDLTTLGGVPFKTDSDTRELLVFFWATWCSECKDKMKNDLPKLQKKGMQLVTVNIDENLNRARAFVKKRQIELTVLRDESRNLLKRLEVSAAPHWAFFRKQGEDWQLVDQAVGFDLARIKKLLN